MEKKIRMRVYAPDWNTNFMDHLPLVQRPAEPGEPVKQVVSVNLPVTTKREKEGSK
jgi:hypothetical protein